MSNIDRKYGGAESSSIACTWFADKLPNDEKEFCELCERCPTIAEAWGQVEEAPMTKKLHLQWCAKTISKTHKAGHVRALQEVFTGCHIELCYKSILASVRYCTKSATSVRGPWKYTRKGAGNAAQKPVTSHLDKEPPNVASDEWFVWSCYKQINYLHNTYRKKPDGTFEDNAVNGWIKIYQDGIKEKSK